jgi:hypothetical protein
MFRLMVLIAVALGVSGCNFEAMKSFFALGLLGLE